MKKVLFCLTSLFLAVILVSVTLCKPIPGNLPDAAIHPFNNLHTPWVDSVFNSLTPEQRIGQLFFAAAYSNLGKKHVDAISGYIDRYHIGGLIFFQGGPVRQAMLTNRYQALARTPLLIGIDAEWGLGMRLDSCMSFPRQMALGAADDTALIRQMGVETGRQCRMLGVHLNFAPVVDVNSNPLNPVIGTRSFGENSNDVVTRSLAYMKGMQQQGLLTAAKHFPGHGNASIDSHVALPVIHASYTHFDTLEWLPYKEMIRNGLTGTLAGHIHAPALDSMPGPATLSHRILTHILRDSLKFNGLIYTDALNMKGATAHANPGEIEIRALEAGADVLLMPADIPMAIAAVKAAIDSGRINRTQVELSCRRILAAKEWAGLNRYQPADTSQLLARLNTPDAALLNRRLVEASLTVVQNNDSILPLKHLDTETTAFLTAGTSQAGQFLRTLSLYEENDSYILDRTVADRKKANTLLAKLKTYRRVIVGIHATSLSPTRNYGITPATVAFIDRLCRETRVVLCLFAPPYALSAFKNRTQFAAIVAGYQDNTIVQDCTAQLLYGAIPARGTLPVSIDSVYHYRQGIRTDGGLRLKYSVPAEAQIRFEMLTPIDTMIQNAIAARIMPGCQVLAARNGIVFFRKEYGRINYNDDADPVTSQHIYDLASVSKIAAALPSFMLLHDRKQIRLDDRLGDLLPEFRRSDKEAISMIDLLTHQAQLQSFIAFYLQTLEPIDSCTRLLSATPGPLHSIKLGPKTWLNSQYRYRSGYYSTSNDEQHCLQVADSMHIISAYRDTILSGIRNSKLLPRKRYTYSDLGFIVLTEVIERLSKQPIDVYTKHYFYRRLGAATLGYHPLKRFPLDRVAPTANDTLFRHQWLRGYVHDENAAMMGGVSGHAGLFGNANDLAKLMQMYMNRGVYGGEHYICDTTMHDFTMRPFAEQGNHRGIGFDKPELKPATTDLMGKYASAESFGHTGFTGTMVWMDPANGLLFIFLSNRVCPDAGNNRLNTSRLRSRIYEVLVNAIDVEKQNCVM